jgi:predicted TIM-barrel fold metal-dependent hydrolase
MMHHVCRLANARGLTFQIHTGIQEGNGNYVYHSDPALLTNLFIEYPDVKFDCFHIGYPYQQTLAVLAKNFRNVFIDFCWAHIISPAASVAAMGEYLDSVPANKISGFGGDYCFVDGIYGHQYIARENIARTLAARVERGACDLDEARRLARMLLHDNPAAIFGLDKALKKPARRRKKR